jgi:hypothetical protein
MFDLVLNISHFSGLAVVFAEDPDTVAAESQPGKLSTIYS